MKSVIVNADDFGYSDGICKAIRELLNIDAVSETSLMCAAPDALSRFRSWDARSLLGRAGVHLQLTGGSPLSPTTEVPTLIDRSTGRFRNPRAGEIPNLEEVEVEWRRQIETATEVLGGTPTHLDSHHGVHRIAELFPVYARLGAELGVPVRGSDGEIAARIRTEGIPATSVIVRDWTGKDLGPDILREMVTRAANDNPDKSFIEIITHPGYSDDYLMRVSSLSSTREGDRESLAALRAINWPHIDGYRLGHHGELIQPNRVMDD